MWRHTGRRTVPQISLETPPPPVYRDCPSFQALRRLEVVCTRKDGRSRVSVARASLFRPLIYTPATQASHLVFSTPWPAVELKKVPSVTKHGVVFWAQRKPNAILEIYKAFQDRLTFLTGHMIVWLSWIFFDLWNLLKRQDSRSFSILKRCGYMTGSLVFSLN